MKKSQVNAILINQTKKRQVILSLVAAAAICFIFAVCFFITYINKKEAYYVSYDESSNIDYKVHIHENEFFKGNYLDDNKQYIARLINYINASFQYNLSLDEENVEYKYSYRIEADVNVEQTSTGKSLYNSKHELLKTKKSTTTEKNVTIKENIDIDYNQYNQLIRKFINVFSLEDTKSTLDINMYINVVGSCENFDSNESKQSVLTLSIPLTTDTIGIDISNNLVNTENNVMQCKPKFDLNWLNIVFTVIFSLTGVAVIIYAIKYEIKTRTAENIYEKELKKILNNYSSYIQTLNSDFDFSEYQPLRLDSFNDMLEIRDTIKQPILMREKHDKSGAYFLIPSSTKILYVYRLKVSDIEKELQKKSGLEEL